MKSFKFYLDASDYFISLENCQKLTTREKEYNYLSAILTSWVSLEAYINSLFNSLAKGKRLNLIEKNFLEEYELYINKEGKIAKKKSKPSTSKKILFLIENFSRKDVKKFKQSKLWSKIKEVEFLRHRIIHYKEERDVKATLKKAQECRDNVKEAISFFTKTFR